MRDILGMAMALVLLRVRTGNGSNGYCGDGKCFSVHANRASFSTAQLVCGEKGGHLMTVRTEKTSNVLSDLLETITGDFWLGLEYVSDRCSDSTVGLKGYKWVTGENETHYTNWKNAEAACSPRCVSVSKNAFKWSERACEETLDGYLCEYTITDSCPPLGTNALYETPFGFTSSNLKEIPSGSNGTAQPLGTRHVCLSGSWLQAPWSCEVFGGGCDYKCERKAQGYECICPSGFKLETNGVTCTRQDDPCARAGCAQECSSSGNKFKCACFPGFKIHADGKMCEDINECIDKSACPGANKECVNTRGSFECRCAAGFEDAGGACVDVDECFEGPCEHKCINTEGGYKCECFENYVQSTEDMHECKMHCSENECPAECDPNNVDQCNCPIGFLLEDRRCVDIDDCDNGNCDLIHGRCENTPGGFTCYCNEGFELTENGDCVRDEEGSGTSTPFHIFIPTSKPPAHRPVSLSAGNLLGIMVCIVLCVVLLVCVTHCVMRRRSKSHQYDLHKGHCHIYNVQQVIIDKNTQLVYPNRYIKRET